MGKVVVLTKRQNKFSDFYIIEEANLVISELRDGDVVIYPREIKRVCDVTTRTFELHEITTKTFSTRNGFNRVESTEDSDDSDNEEF